MGRNETRIAFVNFCILHLLLSLAAAGRVPPSEILLHRELDLFQEHLLERTQIVLLVEEEKRCAVVVRLDRAE